MELKKSYLIKNDCYSCNQNRQDSRYRNFQDNGPKALMLHSVGCPQPAAAVFVSNWNKAGISKCVHAFIDANTGTIYQTLPWNYRGWHAGGSGNNSYIGVEMCEPNCITYTSGAKFKITDKEKALAMVQRTYNSAVELFAMLCKQYGLNPETDICSHSEGYKMGIASGHADPEHLWSGVGFGADMNTFRTDVRKCMNGVLESPEIAFKSDTEVFHTVVKGDTLYSIAKKYGIKAWHSIAELNNLKTPYILKVGQKLKIK